MGKVLAKILSDFLGLKSQGKASIGIEKVNEQMNFALILVFRLEIYSLKILFEFDF